jgi:hypothetical protein
MTVNLKLIRYLTKQTLSKLQNSFRKTCVDKIKLEDFRIIVSRILDNAHFSSVELDFIFRECDYLNNGWSMYFLFYFIFFKSSLMTFRLFIQEHQNFFVIWVELLIFHTSYHLQNFPKMYLYTLIQLPMHCM